MPKARSRAKLKIIPETPLAVAKPRGVRDNDQLWSATALEQYSLCETCVLYHPEDLTDCPTEAIRFDIATFREMKNIKSPNLDAAEQFLADLDERVYVFLRCIQGEKIQNYTFKSYMTPWMGFAALKLGISYAEVRRLWREAQRETEPVCQAIVDANGRGHTHPGVGVTVADFPGRKLCGKPAVNQLDDLGHGRPWVCGEHFLVFVGK